MTFFDFLDVHYRNLTIGLQKQWSVSQDGKSKASYALIQAQLKFFKFLHIPLLLSEFVLVKCRLRKAPRLIVPAQEKEVVAQTKKSEAKEKLN